MEVFRIGKPWGSKGDYDGITGYECSFVLDKTTDNGKISFTSEVDITDLDPMTPCCIIHDINKGLYTNEKTSDGISYRKPTNNCDEYLMGSINKIYMNGLYTYVINLLEPIEVLKGIICETLQFTNQIEKKVNDVTYVKDRLNHLSVLEKILKVTPANNDVLDGVYSHLKRAWFNKIIIADKEFLKSVPFNDDTINESSLYEILMNKFDSNLGRTPVLYFGVNDGCYILDFIRQDGFDKEQLSLSDIKNIETQIESKTTENYAKGVVSNVTNMIPALKDYSISEYVYAVPEVETNDRDLTKFGSDSEKGIWVLKLNHNIKSIEKIEKVELSQGQYGGGDSIRRNYLRRNILNMNVLEYKEYIANEELYDTRNVIWYTEGDNVIHLNDFYYVKQEYGGLYGAYGISVSIYKVTYTPLVNFRYDLAEDYQVQVNQIDSQVSSEGFSNYLSEYLKSLNKWDLILQCNYDNYEDIIEVGTRIDDYIITSVGIKNRGLEYTVVYQLNKNHTRKSDSIQAPQNIRKSIAIGLNETKDRMSMFVDKFYLSDKVDYENKDILSYQKLNMLGIDKTLLFSPLLTAEKDIAKNPQIAYITFKSTLKKDTGETEEYSVDRLCDITKDYFNDTLMFNLRYNDNAEAGKKRIKNVNLPFATPSQQLPILYVDFFGEIEKFNINFLNTSKIKEISSVDINITANDDDTEYYNEFNRSTEIFYSSSSYPDISGISTETLNNPVFTVNDINYYKDMLDIFNYTIGLNIGLSNKIILCKQFFLDNILLNFSANSSGNHINKIKTFNVNVTENDLDFMTPIETINIDSSVYNKKELPNIDTILITLTENITQECKSIVLYEDDKPVLIYNNPVNYYNRNTITIYC